MKLDGSHNLLKGLGESLGLFVGFTSVSGRFGNAGQVDYAAANDALSRLCSALNAAPTGPKGLAIDWTAWADVGMATRGSVATVLEHMGVEMLPPAIGAEMVGDLRPAGRSARSSQLERSERSEGPLRCWKCSRRGRTLRRDYS